MIERTWTFIEYAKHETKLMWKTRKHKLKFSRSLHVHLFHSGAAKIDKVCNKFQSIYHSPWQVRVETKANIEKKYETRVIGSGNETKEFSRAMKCEARLPWRRFSGVILSCMNIFNGDSGGVRNCYTHVKPCGNAAGRWFSSVPRATRTAVP